MANFQQVKTALQHAASNQTAAKAFLHDPAAAWASAGGTLPPGVSSQKFFQRAAASKEGMHHAIVSASSGQMGILDSSPCGACQATVGYCLAATGVVSGGVVVVMAPEVMAVVPWLAEFCGVSSATMGAMMTGAVGAVGASIAHSICRTMGQCR